MESNLKMHIQSSPVDDRVKIYFLEVSPTNRRQITYDSKEKALISTTHEAGTIVEPFLEMPKEFFDFMASEMVDYAKKENIKTKEQSYFEEKLQSTEYHLEDMRKYLDMAMKKITK